MMGGSEGSNLLDNSSSTSRGLGVSLLERVAASCPGVVTLLTTQYRCSTQYSVVQYPADHAVQVQYTVQCSTVPC